MAQDYHIYLHSDQASSIKGHTQPKEDTMDGAFSPSVSGAFSEAKSFATSGFQPYINTGIAALSKVVPAVAIAVAVVKTADKVLTTGFGHLETYTGHYEYSMGLNNFKTSMGAIINPIGSAYKILKINIQNEINNKRQEEIRSLYGEQKVGV